MVISKGEKLYITYHEPELFQVEARCFVDVIHQSPRCGNNNIHLAMNASQSETDNIDEIPH